MSGIDLTTAQTQLNTYIAAEAAVLGGQEYKIGTRMMKRADLAAIRDGITYWNNQVRILSQSTSGKGRSRTVNPGW